MKKQFYQYTKRTANLLNKIQAVRVRDKEIDIFFSSQLKNTSTESRMKRKRGMGNYLPRQLNPFILGPHKRLPQSNLGLLPNL